MAPPFHFYRKVRLPVTKTLTVGTPSKQEGAQTLGAPGDTLLVQAQILLQSRKEELLHFLNDLDGYNILAVNH